MNVGFGGPKLLPRYDEVRVQHAFHGGRVLLVGILVLGLFQGQLENAGWWGLTVIASSVLALVFVAQHLLTQRNIGAVQPPDWLFVLIDTVLALGLITLISDGASPVAWVALVVPVVEAALAYNPGVAIAVWAFITLCHLAWSFNVAANSDTAEGSLILSLQQLLAILLLAIPSILLAGSFRRQLGQLKSAKAIAERDTLALELVGGEVGRMSAMKSPADVLSSCAEGAVELGFVAAEVLIEDREGWRVVAARHSVNHPIVAPEVLAPQATHEFGAAELWPDSENRRQELHTYCAGFGRAVRLNTLASNPQPVLRVWGVPNTRPQDYNMKALVLLVSQTAKIHDTVQASVEVARRTEELAFQASHDQLTTLANHRTIVSTLRDMVDGPERASLLFIDLNGFKPINDTHGHEAGDQALVIIARRLEHVVGSKGLVGRLGGDEFVVMGPSEGLASVGDSFGVAHDILTAIREPMLINGVTMSLDASIGAAVETPDLTSEELLRRADQAMYEAKEAGDGFRVWGTQPLAQLAQTALLDEIQQAR